MSSYNPCLLGTHLFIYRLIRISSKFTEPCVLHVVVNPLPDMGDPGEHGAVPACGPDPLAPAGHAHQRVLTTLLVREWSPTVTLTTSVSN